MANGKKLTWSWYNKDDTNSQDGPIVTPKIIQTLDMYFTDINFPYLVNYYDEYIEFISISVEHRHIHLNDTIESSTLL